MAPEAILAFDDAVRSLVSRYGVSGVEHEVIADVAWGRPTRSKQTSPETSTPNSSAGLL